MCLHWRRRQSATCGTDWFRVYSAATPCTLFPLPAGSQDKTIKRWRDGQLAATYTGHSDSVRGLCELPGTGFVSASHDMTLRVWSPDGSTLAELVGHTAIIYSCAATQAGLIASGVARTRRPGSVLQHALIFALPRAARAAAARCLRAFRVGGQHGSAVGRHGVRADHPCARLRVVCRVHAGRRPPRRHVQLLCLCLDADGRAASERSGRSSV